MSSKKSARMSSHVQEVPTVRALPLAVLPLQVDEDAPGIAVGEVASLVRAAKPTLASVRAGGQAAAAAEPAW